MNKLSTKTRINILFDFDGVICESLNEKTNAFYNLYLPFGEEIAQKVVKHHIDNMGVSRFDKIKYCHRTFLNIELEQQEVQDLASKFSSLVLQNVINAPLVPGLIFFLEKYNSFFDYRIVTATPNEEIIKVVNEKKLNNYFSSLHGSPESKGEWIKYLVRNGLISSKDCFFIGDAISDYNAAAENDVKFILRRTDSNSSINTLPKVLLSFGDYFELDQKIAEL